MKLRLSILTVGLPYLSNVPFRLRGKPKVPNIERPTLWSIRISNFPIYLPAFPAGHASSTFPAVQERVLTSFTTSPSIREVFMVLASHSL